MCFCSTQGLTIIYLLALHLKFFPLLNVFSLRQKTEMEGYTREHKQGVTETASPCPIQGPYALTDLTKLPPIALDSSVTADPMKKYSCTLSLKDQRDDYENVPCADRERGFVTNDIYETCRAQSRCSRKQIGWVENEIYG